MNSTPPRRIVGSYSFFNELENCPLKAYEVRIARNIQFVQTEAARWGDYVHTAMEKRIGEGKPLMDDDNLVPFEPYAQVFDRWIDAGYPVRTEAKLGITSTGHPCKFFGDGCYVGGKIDVTVQFNKQHYDITDWKTGKDTYETPFELELHALLIAAAIAPVSARITARYAYIGRDNAPDKLSQTYDVSDVGATWAKVNSLMHRAHEFERMGHWPATPNPLCGWCDVLKCQHNKKLARLAREGSK